MKGDFTRFTFDRRKHYSGIRMQQGRVQLDADWNELVDIQNHRMRTQSQDFIGASGAPRQASGFAIGVATGGEDLTISPGRMYVDGILCENERPDDGSEVLVSKQADLPGYGLPSQNGRYLAYLEVWQRHVTAIEDPSLLEPALAGTDTATRVKTIWQVKLEPESTDFETLSAPSTGRLRARVRPGTAPQLRTGLYRVEVHRIESGSDRVFLKWSRDNACTAAHWRTQAGNEVTVEAIGRAGALGLSPDQWVEFTDERRELTGEPGTLARVTALDGNVLTLDRVVAREHFGEVATVRQWDPAGGELAGELGVTPDPETWVQLGDVIDVQLEPGTYRPGDYWLIPARELTRKIEWPQGDSGPEWLPPHGIERHYAELAEAEIANGKFSVSKDRRFEFASLRELKPLDVIEAQTEAPPGAIRVDGGGGVRLTKNLTVDGRIRSGRAAHEALLTLTDWDSEPVGTGDWMDIPLSLNIETENPQVLLLFHATGVNVRSWAERVHGTEFHLRMLVDNVIVTSTSHTFYPGVNHRRDMFMMRLHELAPGSHRITLITIFGRNVKAHFQGELRLIAIEL